MTFDELPDELLLLILQKVSLTSLPGVFRVNRHFAQLSVDNLFWKDRLSLSYPEDRFVKQEIDDYKQAFKAVETRHFGSLSNPGIPSKTIRLFRFLRDRDFSAKALRIFGFSSPKAFNHYLAKHSELSDNVDNVLFLMSLFHMQPALDALFRRVSKKYFQLGSLSQLKYLLGDINKAQKIQRINQRHFKGRNYLSWACLTNQPLTRINSLIQAGCSPLNGHIPIAYDAIQLGNIEVIRLLIPHGFDVNAFLPLRNEALPLHLAIIFNQPRLVDFLLAQGADPLKSINFSYYHSRFTALDLAAAFGYLPMVKLLIEFNSQILKTLEQHQNAIYWSIKNQTFPVLKYLLSFPIDLNQENSRPLPLHQAAALGNLKIIMLLLNRGAKALIKQTGWPSTAFDIARANDKKDCAKVLKSYETKERNKLLLEDISAALKPPGFFQNKALQSVLLKGARLLSADDSINNRNALKAVRLRLFDFKQMKLFRALGDYLYELNRFSPLDDSNACEEGNHLTRVK